MGRAIGELVAPPHATAAADDEALVAAVRGGDPRAFELLYARYQARIFAYVRSRVRDTGRAEDVTQEIFVSALRRMREDDRPIAFKPWIWQIAKNACIDAYRRSSRVGEEIEFDQAAEELGAGSATGALTGAASRVPEEQVSAKQDLESLCDAFEGLSDVQHEVLVMRELEGRSYRDIGETLSMTRPAVESTLFRARRRLSEEYGAVVSGARCDDVRRIIAAACDGAVGSREATRLSRHVAHCSGCRREALVAGLDRGMLVRPRRRFVRTIPSWVPIPAGLRRWLVGDSGLVQQLPALSEGLSGPIPKAVAAAVVLLVGTGAGVAVRGDAPVAASTAGGSSSAERSADGSGGSGPAAAGGTRLTAGSLQAQRTPNGYSLGPAGAGSGSQGSAGSAGPGSGGVGGSGATGGPGGSGTSGAGSGGARAGADRTAAGAAGDAVKGTGRAAGDTVRDAGGRAGQTVRDAGGAAGDTVRGAGRTTGDAVKNAGRTTGDAVKNAGRTTGDAVKNAGRTTGDAVKNAGKTTGDTVSGTTKAAGDTVSGAGRKVGDAVSGTTKAAGGAGKAAGDAVTGTTKAAGETVSGAGTAAGDAATGTTKAAGETVSGAGKAAGDAAAGATKAAGDAAAGATKAAGSAAGGTAKAAADTTKATTDAASGTTKAATDALGGTLGGG